MSCVNKQLFHCHGDQETTLPSGDSETCHGGEDNIGKFSDGSAKNKLKLRMKCTDVPHKNCARQPSNFSPYLPLLMSWRRDSRVRPRGSSQSLGMPRSSRDSDLSRSSGMHQSSSPRDSNLSQQYSRPSRTRSPSSGLDDYDGPGPTLTQMDRDLEAFKEIVDAHYRGENSIDGQERPNKRMYVV